MIGEERYIGSRGGKWRGVSGKRELGVDCATPLTRCLNTSRSSNVSESALAMIGTTLTTSASFLSTTISIWSS
jgi:hypothetical protein